ncbi:COP9 signalosome complex subunit 7a [Taphrina deformans PYCC 5710]|uniref:COP9 signalosome complex subunit 7a n=1 Tax=Taphrina deformans (strain PYCC 5710 / ATCC 11124 / CBS 356.35 / IMI 108563 / JCM 9778 / NBRC 8474) TaxID=1097556 RepID=R4XAY2_TAPDE|nr:COP9 signalosome complex subunit 7a [Taphrina deformans PYCC 5710]|eukprot:CCG82724.1 COP9 signalosome complex subunit 7a [Taphrina deformans PYCC 5710]
MPENLETYVLLAKQATGKALESLIAQAVASPSVFTFTELLQMPNIHALAGTESARFLKLLQIFSFGTYRQYLDGQGSLPTLDKPARDKLKMLTLVSIAGETHHISYGQLMQDLDITTTRELEDLIIEAFYASLIKAKLNSSAQTVYIESTIGRDINPESSVDSILASLRHWSQTCDSVLGEIQKSVQEVKTKIDTKNKDAETHQRAIEEVRKRLQRSEQPSLTGGRGKRSAGCEQQGDDVMADAVPDEQDRVRPGSSSTNTSAELNYGAGGINAINRKRKTPTPKKLGGR